MSVLNTKKAILLIMSLEIPLSWKLYQHEMQNTDPVETLFLGALGVQTTSLGETEEAVGFGAPPETRPEQHTMGSEPL